VTPQLDALLRGQQVRAVERRAKYLLLRCTSGTLIVHLGMSGNLRVVPQPTALLPHDHVEVHLDSGSTLRFNDPRRFGCCLYTTEAPHRHKLLRALAPEPLTTRFDGTYLHRVTRRRRVAIKTLLLNGRLVTGVGNIYASEALFRARLRPHRAARTLTLAQCGQLAAAIRRVPEIGDPRGRHHAPRLPQRRRDARIFGRSSTCTSAPLCPADAVARRSGS
jgi:formamidopyrimidine-DNA glycosylase